ncbi:Leishmanolysin-like peptidase [Schistosoma japonicum]|nr:Leishmanolysin-like peptidase [Schistosoma japonicum]
MFINLCIKFFILSTLCNQVLSFLFCGSPPSINLNYTLPVYSIKVEKRNIVPKRLKFYPYFTENFKYLQYANQLQEISLKAMKFWEDALTVKRPEKENQLVKRNCEAPNQYVTRPLGFVCRDSYCQRKAKCGHVEVPEVYTAECSEQYYDRIHKRYSNGSGIPPASYVILMDGYKSRNCIGNRVAFAASCLMDPDTDRPILGYVNVCPGKMSVEYPNNRYSLGIFIHELGHALGFASSSFAYMRFPNGTVRTPRDHWGVPKYRDPKGYLIPSSGGINEAAKKHLKCPTLNGVDLENMKNTGPIGTHWEGKTYGTEIMTGMINVDYAVSNLTLGFFEDSGWYIVDYKMATTYEYGKRLGCPFATKSCYGYAQMRIRENKTFIPFCSKRFEVTCRDAYSYGVCHIVKYTTEIPEEDRFFNESKYLGGDDPFKDYCPTQSKKALIIITKRMDQNLCVLHIKIFGSMYECNANKTLSFYFKSRSVLCERRGQNVQFNVTDGSTWLNGTIVCPNVKKLCKVCIVYV